MILVFLHLGHGIVHPVSSTLLFFSKSVFGRGLLLIMLSQKTKKTLVKKSGAAHLYRKHASRSGGAFFLVFSPSHRFFHLKGKERPQGGGGAQKA